MTKRFSISVGFEPHQVNWHLPTYEALDSDVCSSRVLAITIAGYLIYIELELQKKPWIDI